MLWEGGAFFETPPPLFEDGMFKPLPPTGARTLDSRTAFYYGYTLDSPGMIMRIPDVGSQYLMGFLDADGAPFDGAKTYKVTLPKDIPARAFWSFTLYDNQTRSMLQTPQKYPRAGSQSYPSPAAEAAEDGSTTVWFGPEQPEGVARGNWIQTDPEKGWFTLLRLYSPLPSFFTKEWRPGEIELVECDRCAGVGDAADVRRPNSMRSTAGGRLAAERPDRRRRAGLGGDPGARRRERAPTTKSADFLFVQTAKGMAFDADQNRLTLNGVSPVTLFFSDRPERIAGNMKTADFVPFWSDGKDSFLSDPPNADISILEDGKLRQTVVVLQDPKLEGENLVYTVRIISGDMPVLGEDVSVFIDVIGMPLTPVSFAGVDRRAYRRAAIYR